MVRKTKEEAQETYTALLDAAERVFQEKGVAHCTLQEVALAAGMTRGAIYWHFKDKRALFHAMCDRALLPTEALLQEIGKASTCDALRALHQLMVQMLVQAAQNPRQRVVFDIMFHRCEKNAEMANFVDDLETRNECMQKLENILINAVQQGQLPADTDTRLSMQAMHAYLVGILHQWLFDQKAFDLATSAAPMMDIFIAGLKTHAPRQQNKN